MMMFLINICFSIKEKSKRFSKLYMHQRQYIGTTGEKCVSNTSKLKENLNKLKCIALTNEFVKYIFNK